ncbi:MAG: hypothetical protein H3C43_02105 [Leptonema sp. (in: Bacteria)]|nr:hypothetical protein [Leptonema sp. (in: bacteria)]
MATLKTKVTELSTGLGMLGYQSAEQAIDDRPQSMVSVTPELWDMLQIAYRGGGLSVEFETAFENGRRFLESAKGLRGRVPIRIEWKGSHKNPGDEALPVDLRVDHVYLISCKYLSKILHNSSPVRLFEHLLRGNIVTAAKDWFHETAPTQYQSFYESTVQACDLAGSMPAKVIDLSGADRKLFQSKFSTKWPQPVQSSYQEMCDSVSSQTAVIWNRRLSNKTERLNLLWRLLRMGSAPYFILGANYSEALALMIATPWDFDQRYILQDFIVTAGQAGQPTVNWQAQITDRFSNSINEIFGHVEIRWSHGRFCGPPEAKVYLDTDHRLVPGYWSIGENSSLL